MELRTAPEVDGTEAYFGVMCIAGASQAAAVGKILRPTRPGLVRRFHLAAGVNTFNMSMLLSGILTAESAGNTTLEIPTMASLGYTRNPVDTQEIYIPLQRLGLGPLIVNPVSGSGVSILDPNDLDIQYQPQLHRPVMLASHGIDLWHFE